MDGKQFKYDLVDYESEPAIEAVPTVRPDADGNATESTTKRAVEEEDYILLSEEEAPNKLRTDPLPKILPANEAARADLEPPWVRALASIKSPSIRLHNEIVELCTLLEPTNEEIQQRQEVIARVSDIVTSIFPTADVKVFGSFVTDLKGSDEVLALSERTRVYAQRTGLFLPTSDIDLVVTKSGCNNPVRGLRAISNRVFELGTAKNIQVISTAKVPIVKFHDGESGIAFDVSFGSDSGPEAADYMLEMLAELEPMRCMVMLLKLFLQQRNLNEVYTGGIGSYGLLIMVSSFLRQSQDVDTPPKKKKGGGNRRQEEGNLGLLLIEFMRLFGRTLNTEDVEISCRPKGSFAPKRWDQTYQRRPGAASLAIEDPQDPSNDVGRGSFNFARVQTAFDFAYMELTRPAQPDESLLKRILRLDTVLLSRAAPSITLNAEESDMDLETDQDRGGSSPAGDWSRRKRNRTPARTRRSKKGSLSGSESNRSSGRKHRKRERDLEFERYEPDRAAGQHTRFE